MADHANTGHRPDEGIMKQNKILPLVLACVVISLLASCDAMFSNLLNSPVSPGSNPLRQYSAEELIQASGISGGLLSGSFFGMLAEDQQTRVEVLETLKEAETSSDAGTAQAAILLDIEIRIRACGADLLMENLVPAIAYISEGFDPWSQADVDELVDIVVPQAMQDDPARLGAAIDGLAGLLDEFEALKDALIANDGAYADAGVDGKTVAQEAVIVKALTLLHPVDPAKSIGESVLAVLAEGPAGAENHIYAEYADYEALPSDPMLRTVCGAAGIDIDEIARQIREKM